MPEALTGGAHLRRPRRPGPPLRVHRLPGALRRPARALAAAGLPPDATPEDLVRRVAGGDPAARAAVARAGNALSVALAGVLDVPDLPTVVLGGHLAAGATGAALRALDGVLADPGRHLA